MVENDVGNALDFVVAGDGDHRHREVEVPGSVNGDESVHGAFEEHARIFIDEIGTVAMTGDEVEIALLQEVVLDSAHDRGGVPVADFGDDDPNGEAALRAQGAGEEIGAVFEFAGSREDAVLGFLRNRVGDAGAVDDERDGGGREIEVLSEFLEAHGPAGGVGRVFIRL